MEKKVGVRWIQASNAGLSVSGLKIDNEDWRDYILYRHNQEQGLSK